MKRTLITILAIAAMAFVGTSTAIATQGDDHKVVVCKYVSTPGEGERLQTGNNPIVVAVSALEDGFDGTFPFEFSDAQGRSVAIRYAADSHDGDISECPGGPQPSTQPSDSPAPSASVTPTGEPTPAPSASTQPSSSPSQGVPSTAPPIPSMPPTDAASGSAPVTFDGGAFLLMAFAIGFLICLVATNTRRSR